MLLVHVLDGTLFRTLFRYFFRELIVFRDRSRVQQVKLGTSGPCQFSFGHVLVNSKLHASKEKTAQNQ